VKNLVDRIAKSFRVSDSMGILKAGIGSDEESLTFTEILPNLGPGTRIEMGTEMMAVLETFQTSGTVKVLRGILGTTKTNHLVGEEFFIDPRIYRSDILVLINDALNAMYPTLYDIGEDTFDYLTSIIGYDLPSDADGILQVRALVDSGANYWKRISDWEADGSVLNIRVALPSTSTIEIKYRKPFTPAELETDILDDLGVAEYMQDCLFYYPMSRLMVAEEIDRSKTDTAQSHQRAQDVPPFLAVRTGEWYQARFLDAVRNARARLRRQVREVVTAGYGS